MEGVLAPSIFYSCGVLGASPNKWAFDIKMPYLLVHIVR